MPELPEVEALASFLRERAVGQVIDRAEVAAISVLKTYHPDVSALSGRTITSAGRHGKFLDLATAIEPRSSQDSTAAGRDSGQDSSAAGRGSDQDSTAAGLGSGQDSTATEGDPLHMIMHLARGGWLRWRDSLPQAPARPGGGKNPLAFRLRLAGGAGFELTEAGSKKRLAVYLVKDPAEVPGVASLGPDPLGDGFTVDVLAKLLAGRRTQIKGLLRDQSVIAGIGNAYSDEVLHAAKMSPFRLAASLGPDEVAALHSVIVTTLREAVQRSAGMAAGDLKAEKKAGLQVHGRTGELCPVCGDTVREVSFADSSLQYCPTCQTGGKPLADRRLSRLLK